MPVSTNLPDLTPEDRLREFARLLARGVNRLRHKPPPAAAENSGESRGDCLELSAETVLSVHTG